MVTERTTLKNDENRPCFPYIPINNGYFCASHVLHIIMFVFAYTGTVQSGINTTIAPQAPPDALLTLNIPGVVGIVLSHVAVITIAYTCGILPGLLIQRKNSHARSRSSDLSAPTYEEVLPPSQTSTSYSLEENKSYGQL